MAYTGSGTRSDPYIVDNWDDFVSLVSSYCFIKWKPDCYIDTLNIKGKMTAWRADVDFNGLIIGTVVPEGKYSQSYLTRNSKFIIYPDDPEILSDICIKNIFIKNYATDNYNGKALTFICLFPLNANNISKSHKINFLNFHIASGGVVPSNARSSPLYTPPVFSGRMEFIDIVSFTKCLFKLRGIRRAADYDPNGYSLGGATFEDCEIDLYDADTSVDMFLYYDQSGLPIPTKFINSVIYITPMSNHSDSIYSTRRSAYPTSKIELEKQNVHLYQNSIVIFKHDKDSQNPVDWQIAAAAPISNTFNALFIADMDRGDQFTAIDTIADGRNSAYQNSFISYQDAANVDMLRNKKFSWGDKESYGFDILADDGIRYAPYGNDPDKKWTIRVNPDVNDGLPFLPFWIYPVPAPPVVDSVPVMPLIRVHDSVSVREAINHDYDFTTNGIRIIRPMSCTVTEELNGKYICELEHHIDDWGDWLTLQENNILAVPIIYHGQTSTQLFRIVKRVVSSSSHTVKITAFHIWYDLTARAIFEAKLTDLDGTNALYYLFNSVFTEGGVLGEYWYPYQFSSDITDTYTTNYKDTNIVSAIIGSDNSLVNKLKGELYRDNFYFSVNSRRENAIDHAEPIIYGVNMIEIEESVDWSGYANYISAKDNFGNSFSESYTEFYSSLGHVVSVKTFNYSEEDKEQFYKDAGDYFDSLATPKVGYKIKFADLRNTSLYKDFIGLSDYEVGDIVPIHHQRLNIDTQSKVSKTVYDVLKQKKISMELGQQPGDITKRQYLSDTVFTSSPDVQALQAQLGGLTNENTL